MRVGSYSFRYRQFGNFAGQPHTIIGWQPGRPGNPHNFQSDNTVSMTDSGTRITGREYTIGPPNNGWTLYDVYAIQLTYEVDINGDTHRVLAGRDAYVWPSDRCRWQRGQRVATFPPNYPLTRIASGTYEFRYRICEDTFDSLNSSQSDWIEHIEHAFMQWQLATNGLVTMAKRAWRLCGLFRLSNDTRCRCDYSQDNFSVQTQIRYDIDVIAMVVSFRTIGLIDLVNFERHTLGQPIQDDISRNEVIMVDDADAAIDFITTEVLTEFSNDLGFARYDRGCAHRSDYNGELNYRHFWQTVIP